MLQLCLWTVKAGGPAVPLASCGSVIPGGHSTWATPSEPGGTSNVRWSRATLRYASAWLGHRRLYHVTASFNRLSSRSSLQTVTSAVSPSSTLTRPRSSVLLLIVPPSSKGSKFQVPSSRFQVQDSPTWNLELGTWNL